MSKNATDLLRIIASLFIIYNHTTWIEFAKIGTDQQTWGSIAIAFGNQLSKPGVLVFVFLSGFAFGKHRMNQEFSSLEFYANRFFRILPPYLLMVAFIEIYKQGNLNSFLSSAIDGSAFYHLYFIPMILLCYLLFPLWRKVTFSKKKLIASILLLILFSAWKQKPFFLHFQIPSSNFNLSPYQLAWIENILFSNTLFLWGIWWAGNFRATKTKPFIILTLATLLLIWIDYWTRIESGLNSDAAGRFWRISVLAYATAMVGLISSLTPKKSPPKRRFLARSAFMVYLCHPFLIILFNKSWLALPAIIAISWAIAILIQWLAQKNPLLGFFLGEGDHLARKLFFEKKHPRYKFSFLKKRNKKQNPFSL